jgi:hypothetical protein
MVATRRGPHGQSLLGRPLEEASHSASCVYQGGGATSATAGSQHVCHATAGARLECVEAHSEGTAVRGSHGRYCCSSRASVGVICYICIM